MSDLFPQSPVGTPGYEPGEVTAFLDRAKRAYEGRDESLTSSEIRQVIFTLTNKGGFDTHSVDQALWRLEEAFAKRERTGHTQEVGEAIYYKELRQRAQEILDRVARPAKEKFRRASWVAPGYHPGEVDAFCERLVAYFQGDQALSVATVRNQKFRTVVHGYDEIQVDRVLDEAVSVILAVR